MLSVHTPSAPLKTLDPCPHCSAPLHYFASEAVCLQCVQGIPCRPRPDRRLLTAKEVAKIFRISTKTLYREVRRGYLPPPRLGRKGQPSLWLADEVDAFIDAAAGIGIQEGR